MKKKLLLATTCFLSATALAEDINTLPKDTTKVIDIEEVVVIASPKETGKLRELPNAVSLISQKDMQINQITTLKNVHSHTEFVTIFRSSGKSLAPKLCEIGTENPLQSPIQNPMTIKFRLPVEPTPANGSTPRYFPTIIVSTRL